MRSVAIVLALVAAAPAHAETLRIGSKRFTESYILGEVLRRQVEGITAVEHKPGLGSTGIVFAALKAGSIDLYPEYTGTIAKEILKLEGHSGIDELNRALSSQGLGVAVRLGFNNSYALAMREERAQALGIRSLSASSELVASSSSSTARSASSARAIERRWRWPPESLTPRSPRNEFMPSGRRSMNSLA